MGLGKVSQQLSIDIVVLLGVGSVAVDDVEPSEWWILTE